MCDARMTCGARMRCLPTLTSQRRFFFLASVTQGPLVDPAARRAHALRQAHEIARGIELRLAAVHEAAGGAKRQRDARHEFHGQPELARELDFTANLRTGAPRP